MFPNAERIGRETVTLPLFPAMRDADVDRVVEAVNQVPRSASHEAADLRRHSGLQRRRRAAAAVRAALSPRSMRCADPTKSSSSMTAARDDSVALLREFVERHPDPHAP